MISVWREKTEYEIRRTQNHVYFRPHPLLAPFVAHYTVWTGFTLDRAVCAEQLRIVPDASGCIVLHLDKNSLNVRLWGATTKVVTVDNSVKGAPVRIFIEFAPGGLFQLTGMGQADMTDNIYLLGDVMPAFCRELCGLTEKAESLRELVTGLDKMLLSVMLKRELSAALSSTLSLLKQSHGLVNMNELAARQGYSTRHLNRVFSEFMGTSPKQFARLLRVNAAAGLLGSDLPLTYLSQEFGFYDQSHFIRDFSKICGVTPGDYRDNLSDFYNEPLKF